MARVINTQMGRSNLIEQQKAARRAIANSGWKPTNMRLYIEEAMLRCRTDGSLMCDVDEDVWCKHVKQAVTKGLDCDEIWRDEPKGFGEIMDTHGQIMVPMNPEQGQFATVLLERTHLEGDAKVYKVVFVDAPGGLMDSFANDFIGFIHPGEARKILRGMLFSWGEGLVTDWQSFQCSSRTHGLKAQMWWESSLKDDRHRQQAIWSVVATGICIICSYGAAPGDDSDLIPEVEMKASPWK